MTTQVIIKANHGWPVRVLPLAANGSLAGPVHIVDAGTEYSTCAHSGQDLLIHEIQPDEAAFASAAAEVEPMLVHFAWTHLPMHLSTVSQPFAGLAQRIVATLPRSAERTVCLRKLLEAKDCAVRAAVVR